MPKDIAIRVKNLSKKYKVYSKPADMLIEMVTRRPRHSEYLALNNVSFDVCRGEVVGVVGRNGAGKSTLLKILTGTLDHTTGQVEVNGRISAILELGTGFNPEYTGRENVYMGGLCLGMSRAEIDRKIESIIDFSELRAFIDQPFKTYSSGMQARLTFSVAISVDPDILIIDEALAAGDALFQEKCYRRIREIVSSGATVFFVTHSLGTIYELCDSALLISEGKLLLHDTPRAVGYAYEGLLASASGGIATGITANSSNFDDEHKNLDAVVKDVRICNEEGARVLLLEYGKTYVVRSSVELSRPIDRISMGFRIQKPSGQVVYGTSTALLGHEISGSTCNEITMAFRFKCLLAAGSYLIGGGVSEFVSDTQFRVIHVNRDSAFEVVSMKKFQGDIDMDASLYKLE